MGKPRTRVENLGELTDRWLAGTTMTALCKETGYTVGVLEPQVSSTARDRIERALFMGLAEAEDELTYERCLAFVPERKRDRRLLSEMLSWETDRGRIAGRHIPDMTRPVFVMEGAQHYLGRSLYRLTASGWARVKELEEENV